MHPVDVGRARIAAYVEVSFEDLVFRVLLLDGDSQFHLPQFPRDTGSAVGRARGIDRGLVAVGLAISDEHVLHILLGQGRAALTGTGDHVRHHRSGHAFEINRSVIVEPVVFDRKSRLSHRLGDFGELDLLTILPIEFSDQVTILGE